MEREGFSLHVDFAVPLDYANRDVQDTLGYMDFELETEAWIECAVYR